MSKTVDRSLVIPASAEWLFDLTQDYGRRLEWDPFLSIAELHGERADVGVRAWCVAKRPAWGMETEYVTFKRPEVVAVKMTRGPWFLTKFAGSWRFRPAEGGTEVTFRYTFETRPAAIALAAYAAFDWDTKRRLVALKAFAERRARLEEAEAGQPRREVV